MKSSQIASYRLSNQQIVNTVYKTPSELVEFMGAVQAQDYYASLWAIGLRLKNATKRQVEDAITKKAILRTWPMRQTLHFVSPKDVRWMLGLYRERGIPNYQKNNGLTEEILAKGERIIENAFGSKDRLTSKQIYAKMEDTGIPELKNREVQAHILRRAGRDGIVCYASHDGKQKTFALLDKWITEKDTLPNDKAFGELALRYFTSHGPATIKDFVWWAGIRNSDAQAGIERAMPKLAVEEVDGKKYYMPRKMNEPDDGDISVHLLPAFDEYLISYSDRSAMLGNEKTQKMLKSGKIMFSSVNGIFFPVIVADGEVVGTWKQKNGKTNVEIALQPFMKLSKEHIIGVKEAAERYSDFLEVPVSIR